jgi:bud site selection protein 20
LQDLDLVHQDLLPEAVAKRDAAEPDGDLPGMGQCYCIQCACVCGRCYALGFFSFFVPRQPGCCSKHYVDMHALRVHLKSKIHNRRLKELRMEPYTLEEAEAAAGVGQFRKAQPVDVPRYLGLAAQLALNQLVAGDVVPVVERDPDA